MVGNVSLNVCFEINILLNYFIKKVYAAVKSVVCWYKHDLTYYNSTSCLL